MMAYLDDLLVVAGVVCLVAGLWLWLGVALALVVLGIVLILGGLGVAARGDGPGLDRPTRG